MAFDFRKGPSVFSDPDSPDVYCDYTGIKRVWAPQIFWDPAYVWPDGTKGGYMIYYSLWNPEEEKYDRMYYSYADHSFTTLTKPRLMFDWGYATIDADINVAAYRALAGRNSTWRVAYIQYSTKPRQYRICQADERLQNFHSPVTIEGVEAPQHGSFMRLTKKEYKRLKKWSDREMKRRAKEER